MVIQKRRVMASEDVNVADEALDMLFEAEDVAELVAEVTGEAVDVTADDDKIVFSVAGDQFTVTPEGDEEIVETKFDDEVLESTRRPMRSRRRVAASTRRSARSARSRVAASTRNTKMIRRSVRK